MNSSARAKYSYPVYSVGIDSVCVRACVRACVCVLCARARVCVPTKDIALACFFTPVNSTLNEEKPMFTNYVPNI